VIDDNKVILRTTAAKLRSSGYEVLTAEDGASAIRQARQLEPHLILLDLNFPPDVGHGGGIPWDGLLILSWLRRSDGVRKIPVIVITGGDLAPYEDRCMEAGVLDVFLKPIDHDALLAAIRWALDEEVAEKDPTPLDLLSQVPAEPSAVAEPPARRKILFVDDASDWRYLGTLYLGERGYEVVTVEDPINALLQVSQIKPDLVVLDLNLSGESAVPLLKVLAEVHPEVPILIYTGMELGRAEVLELLNQGASNCLRKGSLEELVTAVENTIKGYEATVPQSAADSAGKDTAEQSLTAAERAAIAATAEEPEAAPERGGAPRALDGLRAGTTEELLSAVGKARSEAPEPSQTVPEPGGLVPDEVIESAAESILIVEDDAAFAATLRSFLESHSFHVSEVSNGAEAVSVVTAAEVDLVIFDLTLPDLRVEEFHRAVEAVKPHLCPRIIFMKSDDSHPVDDGFVRRINGISLWKPFPMDLLLEAVQTIRAGIHQDRLAAT